MKISGERKSRIITAWGIKKENLWGRVVGGVEGGGGAALNGHRKWEPRLFYLIICLPYCYFAQTKPSSLTKGTKFCGTETLYVCCIWWVPGRSTSFHPQCRCHPRRSPHSIRVQHSHIENPLLLAYLNTYVAHLHTII